MAINYLNGSQSETYKDTQKKQEESSSTQKPVVRIIDNKRIPVGNGNRSTTITQPPNNNIAQVFKERVPFNNRK